METLKLPNLKAPYFAFYIGDMRVMAQHDINLNKDLVRFDAIRNGKHVAVDIPLVSIRLDGETDAEFMERLIDEAKTYSETATKCIDKRIRI